MSLIRKVNPQTMIKAARIICSGGLVAFPTETVYGLGANALDPVAVARIFDVKERPSFDPLIVHIASLKDLPLITRGINDQVRKLVDAFWPGPLTIVLPKKDIIPDIVTASMSTVAVRMPAHPVALELIRKAGCPIAAPSANKFGRMSPTCARHVAKLQGVDLIIDGGETSVGVESTIVAQGIDGVQILRHGGITREQIQKIVPCSEGSIDKRSRVSSPGFLKSHYSPVKPLYILGQPFPPDFKPSRSALLSFSGRDVEHYKVVLRPTNSCDLRVYASKFFTLLHEMEEMPVDHIVVEPVPEQGIGLAIMDRLRKAAYRHAVNLKLNKKGGSYVRC
jgi:L-threonylcarbamoyladenylate synthase